MPDTSLGGKNPKAVSPESYTTFGDLLKYLRRRVQLTQREFAIEVGYSEQQISYLEKNHRLPDTATVAALFVPALGLDDEPTLARRLLQLAEEAHNEEERFPGPPPYKGLEFFDTTDAGLFFGRELLTARLVGHLREHQFLAIVVGASGSGKSSIVRAGLIPALKRAGRLADGTLPPHGSAHWPIYIITPGTHPLEALAGIPFDKQNQAPDFPALIQGMLHDEHTLHRLATSSSAKKLLLVVDQFEELFTQCQDEHERKAFIDNLMFASIEETSSLTSIVITLRADFYAHCAQYENLREALSKYQEYIGPMNAAELRRAIEEPASQGGWDLEPGLVDLVLHDVGEEPGALPLLSHALLETWKRRHGKIMTIAGYTESGGVRGAIARTADYVYQALTAEQQTITRRIFLRLTELGSVTGEDGLPAPDTRRRASLEELIPHSQDSTETHAVLQELADARLVTIGKDSVEVAHEALIREWPALRQWLTEDRAGLLFRRQLIENAREWETLDQRADVLYRGARLAEAAEWAERHADEMAVMEREFLDASLAESNAAEKEKQDQVQRELEAAQKLAETESRAAGRLRKRAIYLAGALIIAVLMAFTALFFGERARQSAALAQAESRNTLSRELAAASINNLEIDPELSILLALQSASVADTLEAEDALHRSILTSRVLFTLHHNAEVWSVTFSPDGKQIATASQDGTAKIWDAFTGGELLTLSGHRGSVNGVAFSPDGKLIATTSDDQSVKVWDATTGEELLTLLGHTAPVLRVAFSPNGTRLVTASNDGTAKVWDLSASADAGPRDLFTLTGHAGPVFDAAFSSDGMQIATSGADGDVKLWNARSGAELLSLPVKEGAFLRGVAFSPDGKRLAVAGNFGLSVAKIWDAVTGKEIFRGPAGDTNSLYDIAFSPDGRFAATGGVDRKATIWDAETGQVLFTLPGHTGIINGVAFSLDGTRLATASWDGTARVWDLTLARESLYIPASAPEGKMRPAYSPDGTRIAAGFGDGTAKVWDAASGKELLILRGHTGRVNWTVFSPDGTRIATGSADTTAKIWDAKTGKELITFSDHTGEVNEIAFSPDGTRLVAGSDDQTAIIWDVTNGKALFTLSGHIGDVIPVAFSPDGKRIVTGGIDSTVIIWDAHDGARLLTLIGHGDVIKSVAFNPDGTRILTASLDGTAKIWDAFTGEALLTLADPISTIEFASFSPDGKHIATADSEGMAKLWSVATGKDLLTLPVYGGEAMSTTFSPNGERLAVGVRAGISIFVLPMENLMALAKTRVTRSLTTEECQRYLHVNTCPAAP
jgi:WD40 repeat protein/transcriptional regulator with XRE-family HTH domain